MGFFDLLDSNNHVLAKIDGDRLLEADKITERLFKALYSEEEGDAIRNKHRC